MPPALNIFMNLLERGKMDESRKLANGKLLEFEKVYPLDAAYDTLADAPADIKTNSATGRPVISPSTASRAHRVRLRTGPLDIVIIRWPTVPK